MRMFLYYAAHSFKNQVKKLFKTWVLVFMLACCLIGVIVGVGVGMLSSSARAALVLPESISLKIWR